MANPNPNKVNQFTAPDPRQILFLKNYLNAKSETFGNCNASALKAGYDKKYASNIVSKMPKWLARKMDKLRDSDLVKKAERNLDIFLDGEDEKIKADITKFVLSRLNKKKYSDRVEHTGADGKDLTMQNFLIQLDENETKTKGQEVEDK